MDFCKHYCIVYQQSRLICAPFKNEKRNIRFERLNGHCSNTVLPCVLHVVMAVKEYNHEGA